MPTEAAEAMSPRQVRIVIVGLLLGVMLAALDNTIVSVAMPTVVGDLGGVDDMSWVVTAYLLTATASLPLYGRVSDLYGRRPVFTGAVLLFLAGSVLAGLSRNIGELCATRALQGLGGGGLMALAMAVVADIVAPRHRGHIQGMIGAVFGLASLIGPVVGGVLVDHASWRWIFYVNIPLGIAALSMVLRNLHLAPQQASGPRPVLDLVGAALLVTAVGGFLCFLERGQALTFTNPQSWGPGAAAATAAVAFVAWERHAPEPVLPLRLFRVPEFSLTGGVAFGVGVAMFAAIVYVPVYLQVAQGMSATRSGLLLVAMTFGLMLTSMGAGRAISRTGRYRAYPVAGTALVAAATALLTRLDRDTSTATVAVTLALLGLGIGMVSQVLVLAVQTAVDPRDVGVASAGPSFFRSLGGTVGTAVGGAIMASVVTDRLGSSGAPDLDASRLSLLPDAVAALPPQAHDAFAAALTDGVQAVFWITLPLAVGAFVLALVLPERRLESAHGQAPAKRPTVQPADQ